MCVCSTSYSNNKHPCITHYDILRMKRYPKSHPLCTTTKTTTKKQKLMKYENRKSSTKQPLHIIGNYPLSEVKKRIRLQNS